MPDTPLNPDALKWLTYIENAIKDAGYNCDCATTPDNVSIDKDWLEYHLRELKKALLAVAQPEVNSVEELDVLPIGSAIIDKHGDVGLIDRDGTIEKCVQFAETIAMSIGYTAKHFLPARVLYRPEVKP